MRAVRTAAGVFLCLCLLLDATGCQRQGENGSGKTEKQAEGGEANERMEAETLMEAGTVTDEELMRWREEALESLAADEYISVSLPEKISLEVLSTSVTEEEWEAYLQDFMNSFVSYGQIRDRETRDGDVAAVSYDVFREGELVESYGSDVAPVTVQLQEDGSGGEIVSRLVGCKCGEEIRFSLSDGETAEEVIAVIYWIQGEESVPDLDQAFVESLAGYEASSVKELKEMLRQELADYKKNRSDYYRQLDLWNEVMKRSEMTGEPTELLSQCLQEAEQEYSRYTAWYGYESTEEYGREILGMMPEEFARYLEDTARKQCEEKLVIQALVQQNPEFMPETAQIREGLMRYAYTYGYDGEGDGSRVDGEEDGQDFDEEQEQLGKQVILALARENILTYLESLAEITYVERIVS